MGTLWQFFGFPDPEAPSPETVKRAKKRKTKKENQAPGQQLTIVSPDEVLPVEKVAEHFYDDKVGIHNCPEWQTTRQVNINDLDVKRNIYACTKLSNEQIIQKYCSNYKIIRIWDIE